MDAGLPRVGAWHAGLGSQSSGLVTLPLRAEYIRFTFFVSTFGFSQGAAIARTVN